ncbi:MAG TPA: response regulator transcription factor [Brumimicrobium sp.]|nr:response regulator transcription factor [Brumimicrobium sp.]
MSEKIKILLAEDDTNLGMLLETFLKAKGYDVDLARNGQIALEKYNSDSYQFLIFDVMMPEMDGFTLAKEIRETDKHIPILFLTARSMKEDKLEGFALGADDYLSKPFSMEELLARVQAILKRVTGVQEEILGDNFQVGRFNFDAQKRIIDIDGEEVKLTTKESQLLKLLAKNKHQVLDRQAALRAIWGDDNYFNGRSMDVYIAKLRKILKADENIEIMNIHGQGFKLLD